jgi:hypothetical protein
VKSDDLTPEECDAIHGLGAGIVMQRVLPRAITDRLIAFGLVERKLLGGFVLTENGQRILG